MTTYTRAHTLSLIPLAVAASITHPQNGLESSTSQMYSNYYNPCPTQPLGHGGVGSPIMVSNVPNGGDDLMVAAHNRNKRLKRMLGSLSSVKDEVESLGDESDVSPTYYVKNNGLSGSGGWSDERGPMDHG